LSYFDPKKKVHVGWLPDCIRSLNPVLFSLVGISVVERNITRTWSDSDFTSNCGRELPQNLPKTIIRSLLDKKWDYFLHLWRHTDRFKNYNHFHHLENTFAFTIWHRILTLS